MARRKPKTRPTQGSKPPTTTVAATSGRGFFGGLVGSSSDPQAFQKNIECDPHESLLANPTVFAAFTLIADDISKLRIKLVQRADFNSIWEETENAAYSPVLRKPNHYQTRIQFLHHWVTSKLSQGNTIVLKERDARGIVVKLHILDWRLVTPLVTDMGDVYYQLGGDWLAGTWSEEAVIVPASEIIHDRGPCLFHPLVGVSPLFAAGFSATQANRIQTNSSRFFQNASRPSGMLTSEHTIPDEVAKRLKEHFEANFSGQNIGRLLVAGDGLEYKGMSIPAEQSQLVEQARAVGEEIARVLHIPAYKLGLGQAPTFNNISQLNQDYYSQCLQAPIECIELLLDEGLGMTGGPQQIGTELDLDGLIRMDPESVARTNQIEIASGVRKINEARFRVSLPPVKGGNEIYLQQQNWPLSQLADRPALGSTPPAQTPAQPAPGAPADPANDPSFEPAPGEAPGEGDEPLAPAKQAAILARLQAALDQLEAQRAAATAAADRLQQEREDREFVEAVSRGLMQRLCAPAAPVTAAAPVTQPADDAR